MQYGKASLCFILATLASTCALAQPPTTPAASATPSPVAAVSNPCQRFLAGSVIHQPPALFSYNGVLNVQFSYQSVTDTLGRQLFCFMTPNGLENPTLHVNPGDTLNITVTNNTPFNSVGDRQEAFLPPNCGDSTFVATPLNQTDPQGFGMTGGSMNIHYHGTNVSPACHGDNVTKTLVNPGSTFQYSIQFPRDEPPGLYWYHPHVHMLSEPAVFGGASGALVVDGINNVQPAVAGLRHRLIIIRDLPFQDPNLNQIPGANASDGGIPERDLSVNFVPLDTTVTINGTSTTVSNTPAVIHMEDGETQLWRVCNCNSDAPLDLQVRFDGVAQSILIAGIDGVPVNSQDGPQPGALISVNHFRLPPASRVEFLVNAPAPTVKSAQLVTQFIYSGPLGDTLPTRPLLNIQLVGNQDLDEPLPDDRVAPFTALNTSQQRFGGIMNVTPALTRTVYFEEQENGNEFFINASGCVTAAGAQCAIQPYPIDTQFDNNNMPAIITTQGTVEKWIVQNHSRENHELHQHQIHFKVLSQDNFEINGTTQLPTQQAPGIAHQFLDMIEVPYCGGPPSSDGTVACVDQNKNPVIPYPQVQLLMDFRGPISGDFVFHCHILGHEDLGMMAIEHVNPAPPPP